MWEGHREDAEGHSPVNRDKTQEKGTGPFAP
jgi:hypothetical protein